MLHVPYALGLQQPLHETNIPRMAVYSDHCYLKVIVSTSRSVTVGVVVSQRISAVPLPGLNILEGENLFVSGAYPTLWV